VVSSSDKCPDVIRPSLVELTAATGTVILAHPSLLLALVAIGVRTSIATRDHSSNKQSDIRSPVNVGALHRFISA
jgi:hypothetical protein